MEHHFDYEEVMNWEKYGNEYDFIEDEVEEGRQSIFDSKAQEFMVDSGSDDHDDRKYSTDSFIRYNEKEVMSDDSSII